MDGSIKELAKALCKAKQSFKHISKNKTVKAGQYSYDYAELSYILDCIDEALSKNDLILTQDIQGNNLITTLHHSSGESIRSSMSIVESNKPGPQGYASSVTYARRYSVCNLLCISADSDLDARDVQDDHNPREHSDYASRMQTKGSLKDQPTHPTGNTAGYDARHQAKEDLPVTEPQLGRLRAIAAKNNWKDPDIKSYISQIGLTSTEELKRFQYDDLIKKIEMAPKVAHLNG